MPVVSGRVTDSEGNPIPSVLVSLDGFWTNTGPSGRYEMEVPVGTYTLKAVRRGYRTVSREIEVDEDMTVNVTMYRE